jgi:hypothetical protein
MVPGMDASKSLSTKLSWRKSSRSTYAVLTIVKCDKNKATEVPWQPKSISFSDFLQSMRAYLY